jgi:uncharacterized RDD family membrane protein YckC
VPSTSILSDRGEIVSESPSATDSGHPELHDSSLGEPRQVVRSADQVPLHLPLAGPTSRMLAYLVDVVIVFFLALALMVLLALVTPLLVGLLGPLQRLAEGLGSGSGEVSETGVVLVAVAMLFVFMAAEISYFLFWEIANRGRSPGKALLGLRVVRDGGLPLDLTSSLLRNLLRIVDYLPTYYLAGFIAMLVSPEGKRLGDLAAGTIVVRLDRSEPAEPVCEDEAVETGTGFVFDRAQIERLGRTERALLRRTLRRVERLGPDQAEAVLARSVDVLRARIGYEGELEPVERAAFLRALWRAARR